MPSRVILALMVLPLALGGCGVADVVAHGVKQYEKGRTSGEPAAAQSEDDQQRERRPVVRRGGQETPASEPVSAPAEAVEPAPVSVSVPRPEPVSVEPLR